MEIANKLEKDSQINPQLLNLNSKFHNSFDAKLIKVKLPDNIELVNSSYTECNREKSLNLPQKSKFNLVNDFNNNTVFVVKSQIIEETKIICKICFEEEIDPKNKLIEPCNCRGSMKYIHEYCLIKLIESKNNFSKSKLNYKCTICGEYYHIIIHYKRSDQQCRINNDQVLPIKCYFFAILVLILIWLIIYFAIINSNYSSQVQNLAIILTSILIVILIIILSILMAIKIYKNHFVYVIDQIEYSDKYFGKNKLYIIGNNNDQLKNISFSNSIHQLNCNLEINYSNKNIRYVIDKPENKV